MRALLPCLTLNISPSKPYLGTNWFGFSNQEGQENLPTPLYFLISLI